MEKRIFPYAGVGESMGSIQRKSPAPATDERVIIDNCDRIGDIDVPINIRNPDRINIDVTDVDTVRPVVPIAVVNLSGSKRYPCNIGRSMDPAYESRPPINSTGDGWNPAPSDRSHERPPPVMIGSPAPRFVGHPHIISSDPRPSPHTIRSPLRRHDHGWSPDMAIFLHINPFSIVV